LISSDVSSLLHSENIVNTKIIEKIRSTNPRSNGTLTSNIFEGTAGTIQKYPDVIEGYSETYYDLGEQDLEKIPLDLSDEQFKNQVYWEIV